MPLGSEKGPRRRILVQHSLSLPDFFPPPVFCLSRKSTSYYCFYYRSSSIRECQLSGGASAQLYEALSRLSPLGRGVSDMMNNFSSEKRWGRLKRKDDSWLVSSGEREREREQHSSSLARTFRHFHPLLPPLPLPLPPSLPSDCPPFPHPRTTLTHPSPPFLQMSSPSCISSSPLPPTTSFPCDTATATSQHSLPPLLH